MIKYLSFLMFLLVCCFGCSTANDKLLSINFSADSAHILIYNIYPAGLYKIKNNIKTDTLYQKLISVLQTPADDDSTSLEIEWPGKLTTLGDSLVFTPDRAFIKGKHYLVETILNATFANGEEIVKADVGRTVKAQQKTLTR
jgi:hypothetical protein